MKHILIAASIAACVPSVGLMGGLMDCDISDVFLINDIT